MNTITAIAIAALAATGSPSFAAEGDVPPWNIAGRDWICIQQCQTGGFGNSVEVLQSGRKFLFINEVGNRAEAEWMGGGQISFSGCDNAAILSADLKRLDFIFGSVWVRQTR